MMSTTTVLVHNMAEGTFQPITIKSVSGGLNTTDSPTDIRDNEAAALTNIDVTRVGEWQVRLGYKYYGDSSNRLTSTGNIVRHHTFARPIQNDRIQVRQRFDGTNYTLEYYHTGTGAWETVPVDGTISAKLGFVNYTATTDTVDYIYYCDGNIDLQRWTGGHTLLNGALSGGEATITVDSTDGFSSSGTIDIGGTSVTYTGKTSTTFTGCSGTPAASDNEPVEEEADNFAASAGTKPKGNVMKVWNRQLAVAEAQFVKISDLDDFTDWSGGSATTEGIVFGTVNSLETKDTKLIIQCQDGIIAFDYIYTGDLTGQQIDSEIIEDTPNYGANNFTGVCRADGQIFYFAADKKIRRIVRSQVSAFLDTGNISSNIQRELEEYNIENAAAIFFNNKLYFACQSSESDINDTVFVYNVKAANQNPTGEAWSKYSLFVGDWFVDGDTLCFGSSAEPNSFRLFQDEDGNDILTDDGGPIVFEYRTKLFDFGVAYAPKAVNKFVARGFISNGAEVVYTAERDFGLINSDPTTLYGDNDENEKPWVKVPSTAALGEKVLGEEELGAEEIDEFDGVYPFTFPKYLGERHSEYFQMVVTGQLKNDQYKQNRLVLYVEQEADEQLNKE